MFRCLFIYLFLQKLMFFLWKWEVENVLVYHKKLQITNKFLAIYVC